MNAAMLRVEVVYALPAQAWRFTVELPPGASVGQALDACIDALRDACPDADISEQRLAVFGRAASRDTRLFDGDRVEILRPLLADPKQARRRRATGKP